MFGCFIFYILCLNVRKESILLWNKCFEFFLRLERKPVWDFWPKAIRYQWDWLGGGGNPFKIMSCPMPSHSWMIWIWAPGVHFSYSGRRLLARWQKKNKNAQNFWPMLRDSGTLKEPVLAHNGNTAAPIKEKSYIWCYCCGLTLCDDLHLCSMKDLIWNPVLGWERR